MKNQRGYATELIVVTIWLAFVGGWIANIYKLASSNFEFVHMTLFQLLRIIGICVAPLGAVLGFM
jgi:hypothetical protein